MYLEFNIICMNIVGTNDALFLLCRMAHPMFLLLETFYDSKHRAHVLADEGEVSGLYQLISRVLLQIISY